MATPHLAQDRLFTSPDPRPCGDSTRSKHQVVGQTKYTEKQVERLKYLIKTLGCCQSNHIAKKYIQMVWVKVPESRGGGLGLGLDIASIIQYIRRSIYGNDEPGLTTQRQMKRFKAWAIKQPEGKALLRPPRSAVPSSRDSTIIDLTTLETEESVEGSGEANLFRTATTSFPSSQSMTPSTQAQGSSTPLPAIVAPSREAPSPPPPEDPSNQPSWVWVSSNVDPIDYLSMTPGLLRFVPKGARGHGFYGILSNQASALPYLMRTPGLVELSMESRHQEKTI